MLCENGLKYLWHFIFTFARYKLPTEPNQITRFSIFSFFLQLVNYELPFLFFGGPSMLTAISLPLTGLAVFCCRKWRGECGGSLIEEEMEF